MSGSITGKEEITLKLTVDQVQFIVCGLRDCADFVKKSPHIESRDARRLVRQNRNLANQVERQMLSQL